MAASLLKGFDYEEAVLLLLVLLVLRRARPAFDRRAAFFDTRFSAAWIAALAGALGASVWLGLFAFKHVDYSHELWWQFEVHGEASRFLRASVGAAMVLLLFGLARLIGYAPHEAPDAERRRPRRRRPGDRRADVDVPLSGVSPGQGAAVQRRPHRVRHVRRAGAHVGRARRSGWTRRSAQRSHSPLSRAVRRFRRRAGLLRGRPRPICIGTPTSA